MCWSFTSLVDLNVQINNGPFNKKACINWENNLTFFLDCLFLFLSIIYFVCNCVVMFIVLPNKCVKATDCVIKKTTIYSVVIVVHFNIAMLRYTLPRYSIQL